MRLAQREEEPQGRAPRIRAAADAGPQAGPTSAECPLNHLLHIVLKRAEWMDLDGATKLTRRVVVRAYCPPVLPAIGAKLHSRNGLTCTPA